MSRMFMTYETEMEVQKIRRTDKEIIKLSNEIYEIIREDVEKAKKQSGRDYITYTPERKIGKTLALIKIGIEYNYPVLLHNLSMANWYKKEAKQLFGKDVMIYSYNEIPNRIVGCSSNIILKDEMIDIVQLRNKLNDTGLSFISVVGIN